MDDIGNIIAKKIAEKLTEQIIVSVQTFVEPSNFQFVAIVILLYLYLI